MSRESRSIQLHRRKPGGYNLLQSSGVSKAIWPTYKRRRVATGKFAQIRRAIIGVITRWVHSYRVVYRRGRQVLSRQVTIAYATQCSMAVLATTIIMTMSLLYDWSILLVFIALCMMMTIIIMQFLLRNAYALDTRPVTTINDQHITTEIQDLVQTPLPVTVQDIQVKPTAGYPTLSFPDTPMPATPLIRILETIDLSSTNVEHFLDSQKQAPPETEITWHAQQKAPQASEQTKYEV